MTVLEEVGDKYRYQYQVRSSDTPSYTDGLSRPYLEGITTMMKTLERRRGLRFQHRQSLVNICMKIFQLMFRWTGIIWNTEKYHGSPLELKDERLGNLASWVQHHNITVVKLDCLIKEANEEQSDICEATGRLCFFLVANS